MSTSATAPNREPECEIATCSWPLGPCQRRCAPNRESDHVIPDGCRDGCEHETLPADGPPVEDRLEPLLLGPMDGREVEVPASEGRIVIRFDGQIVWPTALAEAYIEGGQYGRYDRDAEGRLVWAGWVE